MLIKRFITIVSIGLLLQSVAYARTSSCITGDAKYLLEKSHTYIKEINAAAKKYKVDPHLIRSVIAIESCYNHKAVSHAGAEGLMQLMPATAERFGVDDSFDSQQNVFAGAKYLRFLQRRYKGDLTKVLAAYNAGEGRVDRYGGVPPYKETQQYVKHVTATYQKLRLVNKPKPKPKAIPVKKRVVVKRLVQHKAVLARPRVAANSRRVATAKPLVVRSRRVAVKPRVVKRKPNSRNRQQVRNIPIKPWGKPGRQGIAVLRQRAPHLFKRQYLVPKNRLRLKNSFASRQR